MDVPLSPCTRARKELCTTGQGAECDWPAAPCSRVRSPLCVPHTLPSSDHSTWIGATSQLCIWRNSWPKPALARMLWLWKDVWNSLSDGGLDPRVVSLDSPPSDQSNQNLWKAKKAILRTWPVTPGLRPQKWWQRTAEVEVRGIYSLAVEYRTQKQSFTGRGMTASHGVLMKNSRGGIRGSAGPLQSNYFQVCSQAERSKGERLWLLLLAGKLAAVRRASVLQPSSLLNLNFHLSTVLPEDHLFKPKQTSKQNQNRQKPNSSQNLTWYFNLTFSGYCFIRQSIYSLSITYLSFKMCWVQHK